MCIVLLVCRNVRAEETTENTETFKMSDRVYMCSKWLSSVIDNFCNNVYKIVKRDTSIMLGMYYCIVGISSLCYRIFYISEIC